MLEAADNIEPVIRSVSYASGLDRLRYASLPLSTLYNVQCLFNTSLDTWLAFNKSGLISLILQAYSF